MATRGRSVEELTAQVPHVRSELERTATADAMIEKLKDIRNRREALEQEDKKLEQQRDALVRGLFQLYGYRRAPAAKIADAAGVNRTRLYQIRDE
jgi:hypothetical protein